MKFLINGAATILLSLGFAVVALAELPQISDARVVQPPPGSKVAAAYFTINNTGSDQLEITDVSSDMARDVEIHLSSVENEVAKMQKQDSVTVNAGESLEFKHGSFHVMLMGLNEELVAGNNFNLVLSTSAGEISVSVPVISLNDAMTHHHKKSSMDKSSGDRVEINDSKHETHGSDALK